MKHLIRLSVLAAIAASALAIAVGPALAGTPQSNSGNNNGAKPQSNNNNGAKPQSNNNTTNGAKPQSVKR